ncbi:preprotein translocase subunit SecG [Patescibacteria group bacterium]|nr:preprotein translocase subunit SecG [Patescibacteria group bacterium]
MIIVLQVIQIVIGILAVILVIIQSKGGGFTAGISSNFSFYRSRRGLEKLTFYFTIFLFIAFMANSLAIVFLK